MSASRMASTRCISPGGAAGARIRTCIASRYAICRIAARTSGSVSAAIPGTPRRAAERLIPIERIRSNGVEQLDHVLVLGSEYRRT